MRGGERKRARHGRSLTSLEGRGNGLLSRVKFFRFHLLFYLRFHLDKEIAGVNMGQKLVPILVKIK